MNTQQLVGLGGPVKALGNNRVGGHLVLFGSPAEKDLQGEFFSKATDFWDLSGSKPVIYHHGFTKALGRRRIGGVTLKADDAGLWAEGELKARDEYEKRYADKILAMVNAGKLGWSSGSANHLVETTKAGEILSWPIVEASLTPTPVEPRTRVIPLKSLLKSDPTPDTLAELQRLIRGVKAGRVLSDANRKRLQALADAIGPVLADLKSLLDETAPSSPAEPPTTYLDLDLLKARITLAELEFPL